MDLASWAAMSLWEQLDLLVQEHPVVVLRPRGTRHPRFPDLVYPLDYGFIDGTVGGDGEGIDVWVADPAARHVPALFVTFDPLKRNSEIKVVLGGGEAELSSVVDFLTPLALSHLLVRRPGH